MIELCPGATTATVADHFGRERSTVSVACRTVRNRIATEPDTARRIASLCEFLRAMVQESIVPIRPIP
jgi:chromosomal replication initiation ATPase DnaA